MTPVPAVMGCVSVQMPRTKMDAAHRSQVGPNASLPPQHLQERGPVNPENVTNPDNVTSTNVTQNLPIM